MTVACRLSHRKFVFAEAELSPAAGKLKVADLEMDVMIGRSSMEESSTLQNVSAFWNTEACGTHFVRDFADERDFYEKFREDRFRTEWHIPLLVPFASAKGKSVLEIGTGMGRRRDVRAEWSALHRRRSY